ncbi:peptidylprolyl isomerase, partial [Clostridium cadaveris]
MINPVVTIKMKDGGIIRVELYPEVAPNTVSNFISLVN